ncbi:hypothetical protein [Streptomyces sp. NBC_01304]|uniref:hypothetical protein n=1 Tax=Streptomyces sp. NBC_01304 TaxID=2903818 RepID=UPI002E15E9A0|nr:hypothetical protein OG430_41340 [Streptomyces sp. NBC_01304]
MTDCPHPTKSRFATRAAAVNASRRVRIRANLQLAPYECVCTWWHLTKNTVEAPLTADEADRADVEHVASLPDIDFREIVVADLRSQGTRADRAVLRHELNLRRWKRHLGQLIDDVNMQLKDRKHDTSLEAHNWRKRTVSYRNTIDLRLKECRRLRAVVHADAFRKNDYRRRDVEIAAAAGATVKELRHHAGEIAVGRLIDAHGAEFARYCAEEYRALGLTVPDRIARHINEIRADRSSPAV